MTPMLSTLGFSIILQNVVTNIWGSDPLQLPSEVFDDALDARPGQRQRDAAHDHRRRPLFWSALLALRRADARRCGRALRAVAENRDVARLLGVSAGRLTLLAFMLSGALAGAAGVLDRPALCGDNALYRRRYRAEGDRRDGGRRHRPASGAR